MAKRTIRLQPIRGKFLQTRANNRDINIWLVDPKTNQQGTEVPYDDAIAILAYPHPVATPAQIVGKDGKYIQQLTEEDKAKIQELKDNPGISSIPTAAPSSDNSTLIELVKTQGQLLEAQTQLLQSMKKEVDELKKDKGKASAKAAKEEKKK